jgi:hypothetical protein
MYAGVNMNSLIIYRNTGTGNFNGNSASPRARIVHGDVDKFKKVIDLNELLAEQARRTAINNPIMAYRRGFNKVMEIERVKPVAMNSGNAKNQHMFSSGSAKLPWFEQEVYKLLELKPILNTAKQVIKSATAFITMGLKNVTNALNKQIEFSKLFNRTERVDVLRHAKQHTCALKNVRREFMVAMMKDDIRGMKDALKNGADIHMTLSGGTPLLNLSVSNCKPATVEWMIKNGARVDGDNAKELLILAHTVGSISRNDTNSRDNQYQNARIIEKKHRAAGGTIWQNERLEQYEQAT